jgi:aryl-alcohol dehydrogenase-like predicted oxidoreductase
MELRTLGKTGISVSRYCLGSMMFGVMGNRDHDDCIAMIHKSLDAGINFIDTADAYSAGESEEIVGKALKGRRDGVVLATKFFIPMDRDPNHRGGSRRWIIEEVENSLRRLDTDYIDLYQIHRFDEATDLEETMSALSDLVHQGKIRAFGSSMFSPDRIVESHWVAERRGLMRFRCEQPWYSIFSRDIERFVLPLCERYGMGAIVWSPLDGGWLTGRYRKPGDLDDKSRIVQFSKMRGGGFDAESETNRLKFQLVEELTKLADEHSIPLPHLALAFTLEHPAVTSTIIGPRTHEQLDDLLSCVDLRLDAAALDRIDRLVPPGTSVNGIDKTSRPSGLSKRSRRRASA